MKDAEEMIRMDKARKVAIRVLEEFEGLLEEKNITIQSNDKEGNKEEARLFSSEYYALEDKITEILREEFGGE